MSYSKCVAVGRGNERPGLRGAAFRHRVIEPRAPQSERPLQIIEAHVYVALRIVSVLRQHIGPGTREIRHGHLPDAKIPVLDARPITTHVQRIEVINLDVLAAVVSLPGPELRIRLKLQNVPSPHERFPQTELVIPRVPGKGRVTRGV